MDMTTQPVMGGLESLERHDITTVVYNHLPSIDGGFLDAVDNVRPDVVLYLGNNDPRLMASNRTFQKMRKLAKTVLLAFDASDATWTPVLESYRNEECFSLTVNIDGNDNWPKGSRDYTALTPTDPRPYRDQTHLGERPVRFGFAGGYSSPSRAEIVNYLRAEAGLVVPKRDEVYGSYRAYARFMASCQFVLNVPFSGSDNAKQVKGRVIEAGMAGCVLLEMTGAATENWFDSALDYARYTSKEHILDLLAELQHFPGAADMLATNLYTQVRKNHAPEVFWAKLFGSL